MGLAILRRPDHRAIDASTFGRNVGDLGGSTEAGVNVTEDSALSIPTFHTCVLRKSRAMQAMPIDAYVSEGDRRKPVPGPRWMKQPNAEMLWRPFVGAVCWSLDVDNNAFVAVTRDRSGRVVELWPVDHRVVDVQRWRGRKVFLVNGVEYSGEVVHLTEQIRPGEMRGPSIIDVNRETFGVAIAVQQYAAGFFGSGGIPPMVIETDGAFDEGGIETMRKSWFRAHAGKARQHKPGILTHGAKAKVVGVDVEKSQLTAVQSFVSVQIAALTGVPPIFAGLGIAGDSILYQNPVMAWVGFVRQALMSPMGIIEEAFSELMPPAQRMRFRTEVFEKGDTKSRYEVYKIGIDAGFLTQDDVRALEDMAPVPKGEQMELPLSPGGGEDA